MAKYTLTSYEPLEITIPTMDVPEDFIMARIEDKLEEVAQYVPITEQRPVRMYDFLIVTTENAAIDGNPAEFMNRAHTLYVVGGGEMPREADAKVIGANVGDDCEIRFRVRSQLGSSNGASMMTMNMHIEQICSREMPPLTDELVAEHLAPISTVEELRQSICEEFLHEHLNTQNDVLGDAALREAGKRLVEEPDPEDAMPEMGPLELIETCAIDAFADYFGINPDIDEATAYLPGANPIQKLQMRAELEREGQTDELLKFARREATLARLVEEAKITFE